MVTQVQMPGNRVSTNHSSDSFMVTAIMMIWYNITCIKDTSNRLSSPCVILPNSINHGVEVQIRPQLLIRCMGSLKQVNPKSWRVVRGMLQVSFLSISFLYIHKHKYMEGGKIDAPWMAIKPTLCQSNERSDCHK